MATAVTRAQREQYEEDGYYIERGLLEPDQVALLAREIKDTIASGTDGINFDNTRMDGKTLKGSGMYRKLALLGRRNPLVWDTYYVHPGIIAINRAFLGDEVKLWFDSIFTKPARVGEATPWHQDIGLWTQTPPQKKNKTHYREALTIWMAIDQADRSNGCLQVVPGSHKGPVVEHMRYPDSIHVELPVSRTYADPAIPVGIACSAVWWMLRRPCEPQSVLRVSASADGRPGRPNAWRFRAAFSSRSHSKPQRLHR